MKHTHNNQTYHIKTNNFVIEIFIGRDKTTNKIIETIVFFDKYFNGEIIKKYSFDNPLIATEFLRDEMSYKDAFDALTEMGIPDNSVLWKLGR